MAHKGAASDQRGATGSRGGRGRGEPRGMSRWRWFPPVSRVKTVAPIKETDWQKACPPPPRDKRAQQIGSTGTVATADVYAASGQLRKGTAHWSHGPVISSQPPLDFNCWLLGKERYPLKSESTAVGWQKGLPSPLLSRAACFPCAGCLRV